MRVREIQLTEMIEARDREVAELNTSSRKLEKKLRKCEIRLHESDMQVNELIEQIDEQKEAYRMLHE